LCLKVWPIHLVLLFSTVFHKVAFIIFIEFCKNVANQNGLNSKRTRMFLFMGYVNIDVEEKCVFVLRRPMNILFT
jgi:hypothetical protein